VTLRVGLYLDRHSPRGLITAGSVANNSAGGAGDLGRRSDRSVVLAQPLGEPLQVERPAALAADAFANELGANNLESR
jgi:hypothetical protein